LSHVDADSAGPHYVPALPPIQPGYWKNPSAAAGRPCWERARCPYHPMPVPPWPVVGSRDLANNSQGGLGSKNAPDAAIDQSPERRRGAAGQPPYANGVTPSSPGLSRSGYPGITDSIKDLPTPTALRPPAQGCRAAATLGQRINQTLNPERVASCTIECRNPVGVECCVGIHGPRVATASQPWAGGRNPVGVECCVGIHGPRVATASQPWAGGRNPVGVECCVGIHGPRVAAARQPWAGGRSPVGADNGGSGGVGVRKHDPRRAAWQAAAGLARGPAP
jgi:hypothetical protein